LTLACLRINGSDCLQAQSEDDDNGSDDVAVPVENQDGYMEEFFNEVTLSSVFLHVLSNDCISNR